MGERNERYRHVGPPGPLEQVIGHLRPVER
jgi:hypothetical protein